VHHAKAKVVHRPKQKRHRKHVVVAPKPQPKPKAQVKPASVVRVAGIPAAVVTSASEGNALTRAIAISGTGIAALLFLFVLTLPAMAVRYTGPGRVLMDHQLDLVLTGFALLLATALLFALTGRGS
jgi:hypothetical protein